MLKLATLCSTKIHCTRHWHYGAIYRHVFAIVSIILQRDAWWLRKAHKNCGHYEEELYIHENTVVWSIGNSECGGQVLKSFTMDSPVQEVI